MNRYKKPFYIIAHNPNSIAEAIAYLNHGANALEPDIVHVNGKFYVSHQHHATYDNVPLLVDYLKDLKKVLQERKYNLALIVWDMKDTDFDLNVFLTVVTEHFSGEPCEGIAMLVTHADDTFFLTRYKNGYPYVGVGADESNTPPGELQETFTSAGIRNCSYADGITTFLNKPGVFENIQTALAYRDRNEPGSFAIVYTWVLQLERSMQRYLDSSIDGIMADLAGVSKLKKLLQMKPYSGVFELAERGYNPFTKKPIPTYCLKVVTKDVLLAGTNAQIIFTLEDTEGQSLQSLPYHSDAAGALEQATTTVVNLAGCQLGALKSITVQMITGGIAAAWLPERITVESNMLNEPVVFRFDDSLALPWITKKGGAVTVFKDNV